MTSFSNFSSSAKGSYSHRRAVRHRVGAPHAVDGARDRPGDGSLGVPFAFKAPYDKAKLLPRSFRGVGRAEGLQSWRGSRAKSDSRFRPTSRGPTRSPRRRGRRRPQDSGLPLPPDPTSSRPPRRAAAGERQEGSVPRPREVGNIIEKLESAGGREILITEAGRVSATITWSRSGPSPSCAASDTGGLRRHHSLQLPADWATLPTEGRIHRDPRPRRRRCGVDGLFMEVHDNPRRR